jgi:hypothetical protein
MSSFVFAEILGKSNIPDDKLSIGSYYFFQRLKLFAIFTKHRGFKEENEWRVVYIRDRDKGKVFDKMFSYWVGPRPVISGIIGCSIRCFDRRWVGDQH